MKCLIAVVVLTMLASGGLTVSEQKSALQAHGKEATETSEENKQASSSEAMIRLSRGPCFGFCPVYEVTVLENGSVEYYGKYYVLKTGHARKQITQETIRILREAFEASGFFRLLPSCCNCVSITDAATVVIEYRGEGRSKRIEHYRGCLWAPRTLGDLEEKIDDLVGTVEWVGTREERRRTRSLQR